MVTPEINCLTYNYTIYNATETGEYIQEGDLTQLNGQIYYFNFNITELGDYVTKLCDGTTRQTRVITIGEGGEDMILAILLIVPLIIAGLLFYLSSKLDSEEYWAMNLGLLLFGMIMLLFTVGWGIQILGLAYPNLTELQDTLTVPLLGYNAILILVILVFIVRFIKLAILYIRNKREKRVGNYD